MKAVLRFLSVFIVTVITAGALWIGCNSTVGGGNCTGIDGACSGSSDTRCCSGLNCRYMGSGPGGGWQCQDY
jgi:hypothetical protein